jgi:glycosyltransferase involved in cell wall biosynthesis
LTILQGKPLLLIWGVHQDSEGYPNTRYRLKFLRELQEFDVREIATPIPMPNWKGRLGKLGIIIAALASIYAHLRILGHYMLLRKTPHILYVPYPAVFALTTLYFLPKILRPKKIVADAFISIHDTVVNDRKLLKPYSVPARILHALERKAYYQADHLVVDTEQNADFLQSEFDLSASKVTAIPLSTNEVAYHPSPYLPGKHCRILFIGTMIPLHGISTILATAKLLEKETSIQFRLIGNGQESYKVKQALENGATNLEWITYWQSAEQLANEIAQADICLGIFGSGDKAQRVCPFKLYAYSAVGRTVITAKTLWLHATVNDLNYEPFVTVTTDNPEELAERIIALAKHPETRETYAANSRKFYMDHLCNAISDHQLAALLKHCKN